MLKLKSFDTENAKKYRPVSNLPFLSKVARKSALLQLSQRLQSSNLFYPLQSVYRSGHIIETALLKIDNDLITALDVNHISLLSPYDLSAAFVLSTTQFCCPVSIILSEFLSLLCLRLAIIQYYLLDWTQVVSINSVYWTQVVSISSVYWTQVVFINSVYWTQVVSINSVYWTQVVSINSLYWTQVVSINSVYWTQIVSINSVYWTQFVSINSVFLAPAVLNFGMPRGQC